MRVGPSLSQAYPPRLLPAKTNMAVRNERPAPVFQGKSAAQPPMARTATARVRAATAPQGTRPGGRLTSSGSSRAESHIAAAASSAAAQSQGLSSGQSVPSASPTAPGATNTPRGPAFALPLSVTVPPAT